MTWDPKCRQLTILASWVLTVFLTLALSLTLNFFKESQFEKKLLHSANCQISSCKFVDSIGCGCNQAKCDVCSIYSLGLTWLPGCNSGEVNFTDTKSWTFKPADYFSCDSSIIKCYYSCPNIAKTLTLTEPYSNFKVLILALVFEIIFYLILHIVLILTLKPFVFRNFYQEVP
jgi:hypothetical protein